MQSSDQDRLDTKTATASEPRVPRSIPEQIAEDIGSAVIGGRHTVGERLIETDLASRFGVSRGPIREALRILERRRLIDLIPRRGAYVREVSLNSIADLFNTRLALTTSAARIMALARPPAYLDALRRRVDELERLARVKDTSPQAFAYTVTRSVRAIARGSGNEMLNDVLSDLANQTVWTTIWKSPLDYLTPASRRRTATRMRQVLDAIERGAADEAEQLLRDMLEQDRDQAIRQLAALRGETCDPHRMLRTLPR
ncbi:MAG: GntR family transcriptional regulator [Burkholderiaceae bacterium]|nr:GntR family transcriptional regulator [Burkholderiaceae bacterium]